MRKRIYYEILGFMFLSVILFSEDVIIPRNNTAVYVKYQSVYFFESNWDIGKKSSEVKNKKLFNFGNKAVVMGSANKKNVTYLNVQLPDKSKYWAPLDYFTTQFVVITGADIVTYNQPDESYATKIKLQTGTIGYFVKEENGYINVDFNTYAPVNDKGLWLGNLWMKKDGYTDDIKTAEQASYLMRAYNALYGKDKNVKTAQKELSACVESGEETIVTPVVKDLLSKLSSN